MPHTDATYNPSSASTHQLVSAANAQTYALSVTYGDWGKIQEYGLQQTDLGNNVTTSQTRTYSYGSLNEGQTTFAPNNISYADGTNVNEQYGINGSLQRRETATPGNQPSEELYRFGADGNLRLYSYDRLFYSLYGYDGGTARTYKYSFDLNPNWVNGRLESVNFSMHNAMFYPNSYLNFNNDGYYTKHYYNGMERIASRLGDNNLSLATHDPELQDRKWQLDSNIRRNIVDITGYDFLPVGEEQTLEDPKPIYELPVIGISNLLPSADGIYYYHSNHLGSTCYVTDENAIVQQGFLYAPFGEITNEYNNSFGNGVIPKYSFNAKELDEETGMYYYEARYYAPPVFISRDPLFEKYPTFSPYAYCANNPVKYVDPDGREIDPESEHVFSQAKDDICERKKYYLNVIKITQAKIDDLKLKGRTGKIAKLNKVIDDANGCIKTLENALSYMTRMEDDKDITFRFEHELKGGIVPEPCWTDDSHLTIYYDKTMPNSGSLVHESTHGYFECYGPKKSTIPQEIDAYKAQYSMGAPLPNSTFMPSDINEINEDFIKGIHIPIMVRTANGYKKKDYYPYMDEGIRPLPEGAVYIR
jgi:RHS repeat-associated protein